MASFLERPEGMISIGDKNPGPLLRQHLKLDNNLEVYDEIMQKLRGMCQQYLEVNQCPAVQKKALKEIKTKLKAELPDLFADDEVAVYLALKTAMKYHYNRRFKERDRAAKLDKEKKKKSWKSKEKVKLKGASIASEGPNAPSQPAPSTSKSPSASLLRSGRSRQSSTQTFSATSSQSISKSFMTSQPENRNISQSSNVHVSAFTSYGDNESVYAFLANCVPSMAHLYPLFINFGCNSEEYLLGVSTWDPDAIEKFLRRVASQAPLVDEDMQMGEMDLLILQNHFRGYFTV